MSPASVGLLGGHGASLLSILGKSFRLSACSTGARKDFFPMFPCRVSRRRSLLRRRSCLATGLGLLVAPLVLGCGSASSPEPLAEEAAALTGRGAAATPVSSQ